MPAHPPVSHPDPLTKTAAVKAVGMRPLDAWAAVAEELELEASAAQLFSESEPLLRERWCDAPLLPGALRLLRHLRRQRVPVALATSSRCARHAPICVLPRRRMLSLP